MRNQKGITLIALVITIIVLLILAGVSIAMLTGDNGILTQANSSKKETIKAEAIERINLALNAVKAEIYEQQVTNKTYTGVKVSGETATVDPAITAVLTLDGVEEKPDEEADKEDTYWYELKDNETLEIHYKNTNADLKDGIKGTINLKTSPYTITKAALVKSGS